MVKCGAAPKIGALRGDTHRGEAPARQCGGWGERRVDEEIQFDRFFPLWKGWIRRFFLCTDGRVHKVEQLAVGPLKG